MKDHARQMGSALFLLAATLCVLPSCSGGAISYSVEMTYTPAENIAPLPKSMRDDRVMVLPFTDNREDTRKVFQIQWKKSVATNSISSLVTNAVVSTLREAGLEADVGSSSEMADGASPATLDRRRLVFAGDVATFEAVPVQGVFSGHAEGTVSLRYAIGTPDRMAAASRTVVTGNSNSGSTGMVDLYRMPARVLDRALQAAMENMVRDIIRRGQLETL